jgi:ferredoxin-NADP reductase/Na+-translocating ferredoxin:NAD+ oxidoreductase RnfD subunit
MKFIDKYLDRITMYRLVLYYLIALLLVALIFCFTGLLKFSPLALAASTVYLLVVCLVVNWLFAKIFKAPVNGESAYITALILALIISPVISINQLIFLTAAGGAAMASKYLLARHNKHIFNPAAIAVTLTALAAQQPPSWWVGTAVLAPFVAAGGLLLARKLRRLRLVFAFFAVAVAAMAVISWIQGFSPGPALRKEFLDSSLLFLGFVMLTEPLTTPPRLSGRLSYVALVGLLFPPQLHILSLYSTPELALVIGNIYSYLISPKRKFVPARLHKSKLAPDILEVAFKPKTKLSYQAGQYVEITLDHQKPDSRGDRRFFTLASSPTESELKFGVKLYQPGSSFKRALAAGGARQQAAVGQLAGDFSLPGDPKQKLCFIAGGIGVTPYRSMMKYLMDKHEKRDVALFYSEKTEPELVYRDVFDAASKQLGVKIVYTLDTPPKSWTGASGRLTADLIKQNLPDFADRTFYISGSYPMVATLKSQLRASGIKPNKIKTDFFPGYA